MGNHGGIGETAHTGLKLVDSDYLHALAHHFRSARTAFLQAPTTHVPNCAVASSLLDAMAETALFSSTVTQSIGNEI